VELGLNMSDTKTPEAEPAWLDPSNDRKTPYSDAELDIFTDDFIARLGDTSAWQDLVQDVGEIKARQILRERLAAQDERSLVNWDPVGLPN
jgi:hypothetical protein